MNTDQRKSHRPDQVDNGGLAEEGLLPNRMDTVMHNAIIVGRDYPGRDSPNIPIPGDSGGKTPMELLLSHCALDALLNSFEQAYLPLCSPITREALVHDIVDWILSPICSARVKWLRGSAGAGKTAIAQTVAARSKEMQLPTACFFFSRTPGSPNRSDGHRLLSTLVYQLCLLFPEHKQTVLRKLQKDHSILDRRLQSQMTALFTSPLQQFSFRRWLRTIKTGHALPLLIVIDGLDECRDPNVHCEILQTIAEAAPALQRVPVRFLIASRPEGHITREFNLYKERGLDIHTMGIRKLP